MGSNVQTRTYMVGDGKNTKGHLLFVTWGGGTCWCNTQKAPPHSIGFAAQ